MILTSSYSHPNMAPFHIFAQLVCVTDKALQNDRSLCPYEIRSLKEIGFHFGRLCSPQSPTQAGLSWHAMRTFSPLRSAPEEPMSLLNSLCGAKAHQHVSDLKVDFFSLHLVLSQQTA